MPFLADVLDTLRWLRYNSSRLATHVIIPPIHKTCVQEKAWYSAEYVAKAIL